MRRAILPLALLATLAAGATRADEALRLIAKGAQSGVARPGERVVRTAEEWQKLWQEHTAGIQPRPALPKVDFNREMVLAVFMGEQQTGGYSIEIAAVKPGERELTAQVRRTSPPAGAITAQVITHPFYFA